jgi:hypothetical protein
LQGSASGGIGVFEMTVPPDVVLLLLFAMIVRAYGIPRASFRSARRLNGDDRL